MYYLKSNSFKRAVDEMHRGGTQKFISLGNIRDLMIEIVSKDKQQITCQRRTRHCDYSYFTSEFIRHKTGNQCKQRVADGIQKQSKSYFFFRHQRRLCHDRTVRCRS